MDCELLIIFAYMYYKIVERNGPCRVGIYLFLLYILVLWSDIEEPPASDVNT